MNMTDVNVGIIGVGFVGNAIKKFFESNFKVYSFDKYKTGSEYSNIELDKLIEYSDIIYLCLPTPFDETSEYCYDMSETIETINIINSVCERLTGNDKCIVLKSTTTPKLCNRLLNSIYSSSSQIEKLKLNYIHNPEFLSARTAYEDFCNQKHIVMGKTDFCSVDVFEKFVDFNKRIFPNAEVSVCNSNESETMKLLVNNFYASKIMILNEYYLMCQKLDIDYDLVMKLMLKNGWINPMHTKVPGTDRKLGFGGACFSKDTTALLKFMKSNDIMTGILEMVVNECKQIR